MNLSTHFIVSLIVAIVLYPFFDYLSLVILVGGFLIDIDHFFSYIIKFKNLNIIKAYKYHHKLCCLKSNAKIKYSLSKDVHVFHTVEFFTLCVVLSFFSLLMFLFTLGLLIHLVMDFVKEHFIKPRMRTREFSLILHYLMKRKLLINRKGEKI